MRTPAENQGILGWVLETHGSTPAGGIMTNASSAIGEWTHFLTRIDAARQRLRCSHSAAWYRGHADSRWSLQPSLLRYGLATDPDVLGEIRAQTQEIEKESKRRRELLRKKTELKHQLSGRDRNIDRLSRVKNEFSESKAMVKESGFVLRNLRAKLSRFRVPINGEREIFDEYVFRSAKTNQVSSWHTLAEMRHYGVPTRLLDWTDRLDIALYFALEGFSEAVGGKNQNETLVPCVWVLNPYRLSKRVTNRASIWNIALHAEMDYYERFHHSRDWPFDEPVPVYPPFPIERVISQRGYFTVFGNKSDDLEAQLGPASQCIERVEIGPDAGPCIWDYLRRIQCLSPFEVFKDLDSLGRELTERFIRIQSGTEQRWP